MDQQHPEAPERAASDYVSEANFDDMGLSEAVRRAVAERGYQRPTPVQTATYRPVRDGKDVIVRSKTGTGKTAAFAIPILERIPDGRRKPSALVMCPTRELALQVADEFTALSKHRDLSVVAVYGGASMGEQLDKLKAGAEIVVGTPGRIYDHIRRHTLRLDDCVACCLDEADEMLNMGFFEEVTRILDNLPDDCQQLLFSATVPADIEQIIHDYLTEPEAILLSGDEYSVENIHNVMYPAVDAYPKPRNLLYMIEIEEPETAIVFCNTRSDTSLVAAVLNRNGYDAELLNGDLPQKERERVMAKVKRGEVRFMVATDIAARGIDISDLSHVINYSLPEDPAVFLHRVGRTGRIGKKGTSLSLVSGADIHTLSALQKKFGIDFEKKALPTPEEARRVWTERHVGELKEAMSASIFEAFIPLAQELKPAGVRVTAICSASIRSPTALCSKRSRPRDTSRVHACICATESIISCGAKAVGPGRTTRWLTRWRIRRSVLFSALAKSCSRTPKSPPAPATRKSPPVLLDVLALRDRLLPGSHPSASGSRGRLRRAARSLHPRHDPRGRTPGAARRRVPDLPHSPPPAPRESAAPPEPPRSTGRPAPDRRSPDSSAGSCSNQ